MRLPATDIFRPLSSDVDWCEPNYVISANITEFWNTVTSIPMVILPFILAYMYKDYPKYVTKCEYLNVVWVLLGLVGVGSIYFHSTLSLFGQFLDELSILWICCGCLALWVPNRHLPKRLASNRYMFQHGMAFITVVATYLCVIKPEINHIALMGFMVPAIGYLKHELKTYSCPKFQLICQRACYFTLSALLCWILDKGFCSFWLKISFPYLHGFWHILILAAVCNACLCYAYCYAKEEVPHTNPTLTFCNFFRNCTWLGLWKIDFGIKKDA